MYSMTRFILLPATVGIINNLFINYIQRRWTVAMYKPAGLSSRRHMKMTLIEGFSSGLIGAAIAIFMSYMGIRITSFVAGLKVAMTPESDVATFPMASVMGIMVTLGGLAVLILKGRKMKPVEEIKFG